MMTHPAWRYGDTQVIYIDVSTSIIPTPYLAPYSNLNPTHEAEARGEDGIYPI